MYKYNNIKTPKAHRKRKRLAITRVKLLRFADAFRKRSATSHGAPRKVINWLRIMAIENYNCYKTEWYVDCQRRILKEINCNVII